MFSSLKMRLMLVVYIILILAIPIGAYLVSQQKTVTSHASEKTSTPGIKPSTKPLSVPKTSSPTQDLLNSLNSQVATSSSSEAASSPSTTIASSFGPTLSLKITLDGRPPGNQATKLFVGIVEGSLSSNPKFLLNFNVDLPADGTYNNLSLAGLTVGTKYTALVKGAAQIATSVEFTMSPNITNLNNGQPINLLTGDLNEDNTINSADYSIVKAALGSSKGSSSWNENADLNKDGVVNTIDLTIVSKNLGQTGASGVWSSPIPKTASPSGSLTSEATSSAKLPVGSTSDGSTSGYWIWVPK